MSWCDRIVVKIKRLCFKALCVTRQIPHQECPGDRLVDVCVVLFGCFLGLFGCTFYDFLRETDVVIKMLKTVTALTCLWNI